jgi:hypothetical protein
MENEEQDKNDNDNFLAFSVISPSCEWDMINFVFPENVWSLSSDVITTNTTTSSSNGTTGRVVSPDDAVAALLLAGLTPTKGQSVPLMRDSFTNNKKKNHRETFAPRHLLCYDDLDAERRAVVDQILPVYDWLLRYYPPLLAWVVYPLIAFFAAWGPLVISALFRALVLYPLCSWWVVRSSVTFGSMVRALLLLEIILCPPGWLWIGYLTVLAPLTTVVDPLSPTGGNRTTTTTTAGLNWLVLFVATTSLAASSYQETYALLHSLLGNVSFILDGILWLTPGDGWSKMFGVVSIYQHVFLTAPARPPPPPTQPLQQQQDGIKMD